MGFHFNSKVWRDIVIIAILFLLLVIINVTHVFSGIHIILR